MNCGNDINGDTSYTLPQLSTSGTYTFEVYAVDGWGRPDPSPASYTWTLDLTAPTVSSVSPADQTQNVDPNTNVEATFFEDMDAATLTDPNNLTSFTLTNQGSSTPVAATVSYDSATKKATLDPSSNLASNTTYTATIKGGSTGVKDLAGNAIGQEDYTWTFTTAST
jgi:hypothetical protein